MASRSRLVFARFSVGLVAVAAVVVVAVLALWATAIPPIVGWDAVAISSGSMEPLLGVGDVLVAEPYGGQELEPGAVLVFEDPSRPGLVSHRLEAVGEDGTLTTRGDANRDPDFTPLQPEAVVGIGRIVVPMIGWPAVWFGSGDLAPLLLAISALLAVLYAARWGILQRFDPWRSGPVSSSSATGPPGGGGDASQSDAPMAWTTSVDDPPTRTGNSKELLGRPHVSLFLAAGSAALVGAIAMLSVSFAVFPASTANAGNAYSVDALFTYSSIVLSDNPSFWWRLGEPAGAGPGTFTEDFEGAFDWTIYGSGTFSASTAQAHAGSGSGLKNSNNDPSAAGSPSASAREQSGPWRRGSTDRAPFRAVLPTESRATPWHGIPTLSLIQCFRRNSRRAARYAAHGIHERPEGRGCDVAGLVGARHGAARARPVGP